MCFYGTRASGHRYDVQFGKLHVLPFSALRILISDYVLGDILVKDRL
jgi:hypothetical protein